MYAISHKKKDGSFVCEEAREKNVCIFIENEEAVHAI